MKSIKNIKEKAQKITDDIKESIQEESKNYQKTSNTTQQASTPLQRKTTTPEEYLDTIWGWFWMLWLGVFVAIIGIIFFLSNSKLWLFAILIVVGLPFWVIYCLLMMIPDITIFGVTIFSRKSLSIKHSLTVVYSL